MKSYIQNLLPRIRQYSESLDKIELFIDKPWVILDEDNNQQKYIFRRNGELIMSLNGQATTGKWEYIFAAKSLLIDRIKDKILLNQDFVSPAVMVLKMDGRKDKPFVMANELLIPNLNVEKYLFYLYCKKNHILPVPLQNNQYLEVYYFYVDSKLIGKTARVAFAPAPDGIYQRKNTPQKIIVKNQKIVNVIETVSISTNRGTILIEKSVGKRPKEGDRVFLKNLPAPDGKYHISFLRNIHVKNGIIDRTSAF